MKISKLLIMTSVHLSPGQTNLTLGICTSIPKQDSQVLTYRMSKEIGMALHESRNQVQLVELYKNKKVLSDNSLEGISKSAAQQMDTL